MVPYFELCRRRVIGILLRNNFLVVVVGGGVICGSPHLRCRLEGRSDFTPGHRLVLRTIRSMREESLLLTTSCGRVLMLMQLMA